MPRGLLPALDASNWSSLHQEMRDIPVRCQRSVDVLRVTVRHSNTIGPSLATHKQPAYVIVLPTHAEYSGRPFTARLFKFHPRFLSRCSFVVPNPMTALSGMTQLAGERPVRKNVDPRRWRFPKSRPTLNRSGSFGLFIRTRMVDAAISTTFRLGEWLATASVGVSPDLSYQVYDGSQYNRS
jgi:hypothetical protein